MAELVEDLPFLCVTFQVFAICGESTQPESGDAVSHSLADLMPHLPKARPMHVEPRQSPLQKCGAISVAHGRD